MNLSGVKNFIPSGPAIVRVGIALIIISTVLPFVPVIGPRIRAAMSNGVAGLLGSPNKQA